METQMELDKSELRKNSALFWFTLVIPIAIIGIGINFIFNPIGASSGYGIPIHDPNSFPYMWIKGIRDIFSGLVILPFLFSGNRKVTAILVAIAIFVPFCDGLVIIRHLGFASPLLIHWGTAFYMTVVSYFLWQKRSLSRVED
jgi:Domain of unknown function (DUF4267)